MQLALNLAYDLACANFLTHVNINDILRDVKANITDSEKFYLIIIDGGVALRSVLTGCYVSNLKYILGSDVTRCPDTWDDYYKIGSAALSKMDCNGSGGWSFLARKGHYVCVGEHSIVEASASSPECFEIEIQDESVQQQIDAIGPGGTIRLNEGVYRVTVKIDKSVNLIGAGSSPSVDSIGLSMSR